MVGSGLTVTAVALMQHWERKSSEAILSQALAPQPRNSWTSNLQKHAGFHALWLRGRHPENSGEAPGVLSGSQRSGSHGLPALGLRVAVDGVSLGAQHHRRKQQRHPGLLLPVPDENRRVQDLQMGQRPDQLLQLPTVRGAMGSAMGQAFLDGNHNEHGRAGRW